MINPSERTDILFFFVTFAISVILPARYLCSTKIDVISVISKCFRALFLRCLDFLHDFTLLSLRNRQIIHQSELRR